MFLRRKRHRFDRMIPSLLQFFNISARDAIDLQLRNKRNISAANFQIVTVLSTNCVQTSSFLINSGPKSSSSSSTVRATEPSATLCAILPICFDNSQFLARKSFRFNRYEPKYDDNYREPNTIRLTSNWAQTITVKYSLF